MTLFSHPLYAVVFGAFILCAETWLHFDALVGPSSWTDLPIHAWIAGVALATTGIVGWGAPPKGQVTRAAAWGL